MVFMAVTSLMIDHFYKDFTQQQPQNDRKTFQPGMVRKTFQTGHMLAGMSEIAIKILILAVLKKS